MAPFWSRIYRAGRTLTTDILADFGISLHLENTALLALLNMLRFYESRAVAVGFIARKVYEILLEV